jgi:hypothetical protein
VATTVVHGGSGPLQEAARPATRIPAAARHRGTGRAQAAPKALSTARRRRSRRLSRCQDTLREVFAAPPGNIPA